MRSIRENVRTILSETPEGIIVVAATKTRSTEEIKEAIDAEIKFIGENYVQEAEKKFKEIGRTVKWHLIGHLQRNKVKKALDSTEGESVSPLTEARKGKNKGEGEVGSFIRRSIYVLSESRGK